MSTAIGSTTEGAAAAVAILVEKAEAFQFTAAETAVVDTLEFHTSANAQGATSVVMAICADSSGSPGTVLAEKTKAEKPGENALFQVTGFSVSVTSGTKYWLVILPLGGALKVKLSASGGTANKTSTAKVLKVSEAAWSANHETGPMFIAGLATAEVKIGTAKASGGGGATALGGKVAPGTARATGAGTSTATGTKDAVGTPAASGAGRASASGKRIPNVTAVASGGGAATVVGYRLEAGDPAMRGEVTEHKNTATTSQINNLPTSLAAGDLLILFVTLIGTTTPPVLAPGSAPGWTVAAIGKGEADGLRSTYVLSTIATPEIAAGESGPVLAAGEVVTFDTVAAAFQVGTFDAATPITLSSAWQTTPSATNPGTIPSVTTTRHNSYVLAYAAGAGIEKMNTAGYIELFGNANETLWGQPFHTPGAIGAASYKKKTTHETIAAFLIVNAVVPVVSASVGVSGGGNTGASGSKTGRSSARASGGGAATARGSNKAAAVHVSGGGAVTAVARKVAVGIARATGGGQVSALGTEAPENEIPPEIYDALEVHGGGNARATGSKIVSGVARASGGGAANVTEALTRRSGVAAATGAGRASVASAKLARGATAAASGAGAAAARAAKINVSIAAATGGGRAFALVSTLRSSSTTATGAGDAHAIATRIEAPNIHFLDHAGASGGGAPSASGSKVTSGVASATGGGNAATYSVHLSSGLNIVTGGGYTLANEGVSTASHRNRVFGGGAATATGEKIVAAVATATGGGAASTRSSSYADDFAHVTGGGYALASGEGIHRSPDFPRERPEPGRVSRGVRGRIVRPEVGARG